MATWVSGSRPTRACELKYEKGFLIVKFQLSRPTRACELKYEKGFLIVKFQFVTPHAGV